ncbi:MAG: hypothetical protein JW794_05200 [Candidatus Cloacimonetes bacterium]|nr:hypothetical protein [Candidatus Cloacimonadota bacterium]
MKRIILLLLAFLLSYKSILISEPPEWAPISGNEYSMVVFADIFLDHNPFTGSDTCNIAAAFGPGGESDCRSIALWLESFPAYGYWYFNIIGNINYETITFKIYDSNTDSVFNCLENIIFQDGITIGTAADPIIFLTNLSTPSSILITVNEITGIPTISWTPINGVSSYYIYSGNSLNIVTTPGTHIAQVDSNSWSDFSKLLSKKFYVITSSNDPLRCE